MKNAWKFLAGCGCLSVIAGAALIAFALLVAKDGPDDADATPRRDDLAHYVNTREGRTGNLAEHYVDFSFDYPKTWTITTEDPDNINFVTAKRKVDGQTYENLNVGYFRPGTEEQNQALYRQSLGHVETQFAQQLRDFRKVTDGPAKIGEYDGHEAIYDGWVEANGQRVSYFVRAVFVPAPRGGKGVSMMMIGTSLNPDLREADDLGTKGELPVVLESFKFGA
jgi:hypothetical protein